MDMELFQFDQKGPMSPIPSDIVVAEVVPALVANSSLQPKRAAKDRLMKHVATIKSKYFRFMALKSRDLTSLNFEIA